MNETTLFGGQTMHFPSLVSRGRLALALTSVLAVTPLFATLKNTGAAKKVDSPSLSTGSIQWQASFESALARAAKEEKPLMVDFETEWCGFCKKLDRETYGNEQVIRFVQQFFIAVKVDGDKRTDLRDKYSVEGYPTIVFLSPQAVELKRIVGYRPPSDFLAEAGKAARSSTTLAKLKEEAASRPDDADAQRAYARALFASGNTSEALSLLETYRKKHPDVLGVRLDLGDLLKASGKLEEACAHYEAALAGVGSAPGEEDEEDEEDKDDQDEEARAEDAKKATSRRSAYLSLARTRLQLRQYEKSIAVLTDVLEPPKPKLASPDILEALFLRAYAHATLGRADAALADLKTAEELDTESLWGLRASLIRELVEVRPERRPARP